MEFSPEQPANIDTSTLDMEDMLGDCLIQNNILQEKGNIGHKAIRLLQKRAHMLKSTANVGLEKLQDEKTELERQLQGELASCHCQLMAAHVDVETWKRRTGILQLRLASLQEDVDMYVMRVQLLDSEIGKQCSEKALAQATLAAATSEVASLKEQLLEHQAQEDSLQGTILELTTSRQEVEARLKDVSEHFEAAQTAAGAAAQEAEQHLEHAQAELAQTKAQLKDAAHAAAAAGERADELEWRLKQQEAALAERLRLVGEAKQATEDLSEEGLRAVRDKARLVGEELRLQVEETRKFLEDERRLRRAAEAAAAEAEARLIRRLEQASADISALRQQVLEKDARISTLEESCRQQQTKAAIDVVTSLVGDLNPPDTEPRKRPPRAAAAAEPSELAAVPDQDAAAGPPQQLTGRSGNEAVDADKERKVAKKQKRGSKGRDAVVAERGAEQVAGGSSAQVLQPAEEEKAPGAADAAPHVAAKKAPAPAARKQTVKTKKDSAEAAPAETGAAAKADKRPEKASRKRKVEEGTCAAAEEDAKTGVQQEGASAGDAAPGGMRTRPGRARASKAPYWMGGAAEDDSAVTSYDSLDPAEAAEFTAKAKRGRKTSVEALQEEDVSEAAEPAKQPALAAVKTKRRQRESAEDVQSEEAAAMLSSEIAPEENAAEAAAQELPGKSAAAGKARRKLVRAGGAAVNKEEATLEGEAAVADQQAKDEPEAAEPATKKGAQQKKGRASKADEAAAHQHNQPEDIDPADAGDKNGMEAEQEERPHMGGAAARDATLKQNARPVHSAQESRQELASQEAQEATSKQLAQWKRSRPAGVSKIALTAVWGNDRTPQAPVTAAAAAGGASDGDAKGKEKENNGAAVAAAAARPAELFKPVPGRSRYGSQSEANPLAALNPGVLEAAVKARGLYVSGLSAPNRGVEVAAGKRRLLPAPKPLAAVAALPRSVLFGQNFQVPRLSRQ
ncbi:g10727 [Coccomyxa elongata]